MDDNTLTRFQTAMAELIAAYPNISLRQETALLYVEKLQDLDIMDIEYAIDTQIKSNRHFPTIAELREDAFAYYRARMQQEKSIQLNSQMAQWQQEHLQEQAKAQAEELIDTQEIPTPEVNHGNSN